MTALDQVSAPDAGISIPGEGAAAPASPAPAPQSAPAPADIEARARAQGWVAREEFKGPAEKWRPAEEFVKRGEEIPAIAVERFRTLEKKVSQYEADKQSMAQTIAAMERMNQLALQRQRDLISAQYETYIRDSVRQGDEQRYNQLVTARDRDLVGFDQQIMQQRHAPPQAQPPSDIPQADLSYAAEWRSRNTWFSENNPTLYHATNAHLFAVQEEMPGLPFPKQMEIVDQRIREQFPQKFGIKPDARPASVEGGGRMQVSSGSRKRGANDLPAEAAKQADRYIAEGLYKNRAEYAEFYFSQPGV